MTRRPRGKGEDGAALIVALFAVTILTALAVAFASVARTDALLAGNRAVALQAFYAAQSGVNYCRAALAADDPAMDSAADGWARLGQEGLQVDVPGFAVNAVVEDESARLNVNVATRDMLMALPGMTEEVADAILDWRDANDDPEPLGAESDYYLGLPSPYSAGNGPFETLDELRLLRGMDETLWQGDGTEVMPGLRNLLAVRSGERNVDSAGQPRLNINTADPVQLAARLGDVLSPQELAAVERRRRQGRLTSLRQVLSIAQVPWRKMALVLDRVRVDDREFVEGTVNLNTASVITLEAIGLTAEVAQALADRRASEPLESKGDLAEVEGVSQEMMLTVADRVATKSSVFRISAAAQAEERPLRAGVLALVERGGASGASARMPRLILWREETGLIVGAQDVAAP